MKPHLSLTCLTFVMGSLLIFLVGCLDTTNSFSGDTAFLASDGIEVRQVFITQKCYECHAAIMQNLKTDDEWLASPWGPFFIPGDGAGSQFVKYLRGDGVPLMPQGGPQMPDEDLNIVIEWIDSMEASTP